MTDYIKNLLSQGEYNDDAQSTSLFTMDMVHNNPGLLPYESKYCDPGFLISRGYKGKVFCFTDSAQFGLTWDGFDKEIFPVGSAEREEVLETREQIIQKYDTAKAKGLKVYFMMDIISLPAKIVEKYGDELLNDDKIDIRKPFTKKAMDYLFDEMFSIFPQLDGLYIRYGENYVGTKYRMPLFRGNTPIIGDAIEYHRYLVGYLREKVCVEKNREIIYRSWGSEDNKKAYLDISDAIEPHKNLYFCIKHTDGDFHRNTRFNSQLNIGKHQQIVEVQCAREYEGKGAHPNYVAAGAINGFEELMDFKGEENICLRDVINTPDTLIKGVWTWSRGGGWNGPYIIGKNGTKDVSYPEDINGEVTIKTGGELWCDINAYVISSWAKDTSKTDKYYAKKYASEILGMKDSDAEKFYELCILSSRAVLLGRSFHKGNTIDCWWFRDQNMNYKRFFADVEKAVNDGSYKALISEKAESVKLWEDIVAIAENLDDSIPSKDYIVTTSKYGYYLYAIIEKMYLICISKLMKDEAYKKYEEEYESLWLMWQRLYDTSVGCPSLYIKEDKPMNLIGYDGNVGFDCVLRPL